MRSAYLVTCLMVVGLAASSQTKWEAGLHCSSHISAYQGNLGSNEPFSFQGYSIGSRAARTWKTQDFQVGLLFTCMDLGRLDPGPSEVPMSRPVHLQTQSLEIQTIYRRKFRYLQKIVPYLAAGVSNFLFTRDLNFNSKVDPVWFANDNRIGNSGYNVALMGLFGVKCKLDPHFTVDLEPNFKYFFLKTTNYRHNLSAGLALTISYSFYPKPLPDHD